MNARIEFRQDEIAAFCQRWQMVELALFGSVLRDDFGPESDVDILVRFAPAAEPGLRDWPAMERELAEVLGRDVDLIERRSVEISRNYIRRRAILDSAQVVYAA
ncbi:MAG: nucleotidyltransferase domain-containing protein [Chloroflexi bacterium]|nr:nucleotidyltransferase domain-containing protein [Chloroflexota bacterium]